MDPLPPGGPPFSGKHLFQHGGDTQWLVQPWHMIGVNPGPRLRCGEMSWEMLC